MLHKKLNSAIGRLFIEKGSDATLKVVNGLKNVKACETDTQKMKDFFSEFKTLRTIKTLSYSQKKIFIAAMVEMYNPEWFLFPQGYINKRGFSVDVSEAMGYKNRYVSRLIQTMIFEYNKYEEIQKEIKEVVQLLKLTA